MKFSFTRPEVITPNILITNFCNQNCSYCFASENMKKSKQKEMSIVDFKRLIRIFKKNKVKSIRLLGGEPTLHSHFKEFIFLGLDNFEEVWVFTNGFLSKKIDQFIRKSQNKKLYFVFNIDTPVFNSSSIKRKEIEKIILDYSSFATVYIGFTISSFDNDYSNLYRDFSKDLLKNIFVRFGLMKPIVGEKSFFNPLSIKDKKKVGQQVIKTVKQLVSFQVKGIFVDCGLMPEMFSHREKKYLKEKVGMKGWGCDGYWGGFDIDTDLTAFPCFPHSQLTRVSLTKESNFNKLVKDFSCKEMCFLKDLDKL